MKWSVVIAGSIVSIGSCTPAFAYHCPLGQIYRIHLYECVGVNSTLARAYVGRPLHLSYRRISTLISIPLPPSAPRSDPSNSDTVKILKAGIIPIPKF